MRAAAAASLTVLALSIAACRQDMHDQAKYKPAKKSAFFADGRTSRPLVPDTVARGELKEDELLYTGKLGASFSDQLPYPISKEMLLRGQERYNIYCSPCHDRVGRGAGMIVQRGYKQPPTYHSDRLRSQPLGYFFEVISKGFKMMPSYAAQVPVEDRWAIVAYIRSLQLSQHAELGDVPELERSQLDNPPAAAPAAAEGGHHE
jgi:hypothetical protein